MTGIGNIRPTRSPEEDSGADWEDDHMEYLKRFMEFHGLISTALSINVGESPTKWTLTVNGTCCSGLGTLPASTTSTSSWTNNPPSQDTFTTGAEDDSQGQLYHVSYFRYSFDFVFIINPHIFYSKYSKVHIV